LSSSAIALCPAPLTAWYEDNAEDWHGAARGRGARASIAVIVVQFGTEMIPGSGHPTRASGLTAGITRGTSGSIRNALELSMQRVPFAAISGRNRRAMSAP